jgi:signal peptidase I
MSRNTFVTGPSGLCFYARTGVKLVVLRSSLAFVLAAMLGALLLTGCGGSSPATTGASADVGSATTAGASAASTTRASTTPANAVARGAGAKHGGARAVDGSKAAGGGSSASVGSSSGGGAQMHGSNSRSSGGASDKGAPTSSAPKHSGSSRSKPSHRRSVSDKAGAGPTNAGASAPAPSGAASAETGVPYEVSTISMRPNYQPETKVYYDPTRTQPQIGDVIVFYLPTGATEGECGKVAAGGAPCEISRPGLTKMLAIKRVVGLPGDTLLIHNGQVIRNGQPEPEPSTEACKEEEEGCNYPKPIVVPAGHYYVMGDNRRLPQEDSRVFGAISQEAIVGTVESG